MLEEKISELKEEKALENTEIDKQTAKKKIKIDTKIDLMISA
jgi:hypothetical protein